MKIEIKNRFTGEVLFSCEAGSMRIAVEAAVKAGANLTDANLTRADLTGADLTGANLIRANLTGANLTRANLTYASLTRANLADANIDYSCWPLWCGSKRVKIDAKIAMQLAAHFCAVECDDEEYQEARKAILKFAMKSHRAADLGIK